MWGWWWPHVDTDPQKPDDVEVFPWYCVDFGYDPFVYRDSTGKRPNSKHQKVNIFKVRPLWSQPTHTKVVYSLTAPGVFVNTSSEDVHSQSGGSPNKRGTKGIPPGTDVLVASEPLAVGGPPPASVDDEFEIQAFYAYVKQEGTPTPVEVVPPVQPRFDDSGKWFVGTRPQDEHHKDGRNETKYATFLVHRPADCLVYDGEDDTEYNEWFPPQGVCGSVFLYQLIDQRNSLWRGMPGVWVQERFEDPNQIPEDASVNERWNNWVTVKKGEDIDTGNYSLIFGTFHEWTPSTKVDGVFGPDWLWMLCSYFDYNGSPLEITGHRYYAGNDGTGLNDGGVLVATFTIRVYREGYATHERSDGGGGG